jgi:transposase-like protein
MDCPDGKTMAYPLSLRHIEEMMRERGVFVDHATVHRWAIKMLPVLVTVFRRRKHPVGKSWRMDVQFTVFFPSNPRNGYMSKN